MKVSGDRLGFRLENSYATLPEILFTRQKPLPVSSPKVLIFNFDLARELGLSESLSQESDILCGNVLIDGSEPIAQAYAGHQFGHFNILGDGRAILLGEQISPDGRRWDIQLKGSGRTPYSRDGDGRAALGPMLREYLISEAMYALGIPTTRSLAVLATGEKVFREKGLPGAILVRVASSHIRVGTFEYAAFRGGKALVKDLSDYTIRRHFPEIEQSNNKYLELLKVVISRQARLISQWMGVGFIHGVMNTDNMSVAGETIDYGPCAFMDYFKSTKVYSSIDRHGRYAFSNQPQIAHWNLARFAETLIPFLSEKQNESIELAQNALDDFSRIFLENWHSLMAAKIGLKSSEAAAQLLSELLQLMEKERADYTNTFNTLANGDSVWQQVQFKEWRERWKIQVASAPGGMTEASESMKKCNPVVIPRNHTVEEAINRAVEFEDYGLFNDLLSALRRPFADLENSAKLKKPPEPHEEVRATFCGT
ncbi:MAG: YdiU family protein [Bdellovibrionaceae bacterium]|nr:YdiU family protein [Pseudobdellovibrionaceae bacterium]